MTNDPCQACGFSPSIKVTKLGEWTIESNLESGNKIGHNGKGQKGYKYRKQKSIYKRAANLLSNPPEIAAPNSRRRIEIVREYRDGKRPYDRDNLVWGCKPLIDILKERGWFFDDSPKYVERVYRQSPANGPYDRIRIRLFEF